MAPVFDEAEIELDIEGDAEVPVERALFGRAITNLLDNAVRHGETPGRVVVKIGYEGGAASIGVSNPGAAIETAHLDRIFDRFYRIDPARFNDGESHGFGLALVKAMARMHGGSVFARNEPGRICIGFTSSKAGHAAGLDKRLAPTPATVAASRPRAEPVAVVFNRYQTFRWHWLVRPRNVTSPGKIEGAAGNRSSSQHLVAKPAATISAQSDPFRSRAAACPHATDTIMGRFLIISTALAS